MTLKNGRPGKQYRVLNIKLSAPIHDQLDRFSRESGINKTTAVERILDRFFEEYFEKPEDERDIFR